MTDAFVISGLRRKRAHLAGEIGRLTGLVDALQSDLACVDRAICIFDPKAEPETIKPVKKRLRSPIPRVFRHGDFSRGVLGVLRDAKAPMSARDISAVLTAEHGLPSDQAAMKAMADRVRCALARQRPDVVERIEGEGGAVTWRAG